MHYSGYILSYVKTAKERVLVDSNGVIKKMYTGNKIAFEDFQYKAQTSLISEKNYIVNDKKMNNLITNAKFVYNAGSSWTQEKIQNFLKSKNSVLKNTIHIYAKKNNGTVYNTGRKVVPAHVIVVDSLN